MTTQLTPNDRATECVRFETQLGPWLEQELDAGAQGFMTRHRSNCASCDAIVQDLEQLVADAASLPATPAPRDFWPAIAARLETEVVPIGGSAVPHVRRMARTVSMRRAAVAATLLVSATSLVTWQITRARSAGTTDRTATVAASGEVTAAAQGDGAAAASGAVMRLTTGGNAPDASTTYEREIAALRRIVDERFTELDSATVAELRRNLDIIDRAIADSKAALASDPRNGLGARQLDRALEAKLDLLRRVALL